MIKLLTRGAAVPPWVLTAAGGGLVVKSGLAIAYKGCKHPTVVSLSGIVMAPKNPEDGCSDARGALTHWVSIVRGEDRI